MNRSLATCAALLATALAAPLPAAKVGEDDTVLLNGVPVPVIMTVTVQFTLQ